MSIDITLGTPYWLTIPCGQMGIPQVRDPCSHATESHSERTPVPVQFGGKTINKISEIHVRRAWLCVNDSAATHFADRFVSSLKHQ